MCRTCHLYAAKSSTSAQDEFILYDLRGWMVSFCTVSISSASSSYKHTKKEKTIRKISRSLLSRGIYSWNPSLVLCL